jgi:hypothetical protein
MPLLDRIEFQKGSDMKVGQLLLLLVSCLFSYAKTFAYCIVFIHIGKQIPEYLKDALFQARLFNEECEIYLLANRKALESYLLARDMRITKIALETLNKTKAHKEFIEKARLDREDRDGFWFYASERFLYLDDFMQQYNLHHVVHLESDNMLYVDIQELLPIFKSKYPGIGGVLDNDNRCIPGFVYIADKKVMHQLAQCFAHYAKYRKNDMRVLALFKQATEKKTVVNLPIIMDSYRAMYPLQNLLGNVAANPLEYSQHIDLFKSIFDGAALGQYLGGIDPRNGISEPGFINESCLFNPSHLTYAWIEDEQARRIPYALFGDESYRINNLHIHSKHLKPFLSVDLALRCLQGEDDEE